MLIYTEDKIISEDDFKLSPESKAFLYGYGLFETIKVKEGRMCFFDEHIKRLKNSCNVLKMDFSEDIAAIEENAYRLIEANKLENGSARINYIMNGSDGKIIILTRSNIYKDELYKKGYSLCTSDIRRNPLSPITFVKSLNYLENILARDKALEAGYDEAIFLNNTDFLCEGAISNIFWIKNRILYTPALECGLLSGITRRHILLIASELDIIANEGKYSIDELYTADEVFITNSLMDVMPVRVIDTIDFHIESYDLTNKIAELYKKELEQEHTE